MKDTPTVVCVPFPLLLPIAHVGSASYPSRRWSAPVTKKSHLWI